jgi:peptide/nickel transport system substrate-binding protein
MKRPHADTIVLATIVMLLAAACMSSDGSREWATDPDAALRGGTLRVAVSDDEVSEIEVDPQAYRYGAWELARCCLLRTLYSYNGKPAEEGGAEVRPDLAEGPPEVSSDGLTWTFRLKRGLHYAPPFDDAPIVALDIVRALEREARVGMGGYGFDPDGYGYYYSVIRGFEEFPENADSIVGLETPDDRTLVVRLKEITGDLAYRFSFPATAPIPEGASEGHDDDYGRFLVASGPYMLEGSEDLDFSVPPQQQEPASGFVPATFNDDGGVEEPGSLVLVRNPSWEPESDGLRPAYPDRIELAIGGGDAEEFADRVDAAEIDFVFAGGGSPFEQVARYRKAPALADRLHVDARDVGFAITMNLAAPPFDDVHVRRAVNFAIDEAALLDLLSIAPHDPGNGAGEAGAHIAPDTFEGSLLRAFDPYPYDPAAAREEMRASAYDRTGDGVCDAQVCRDVRAPVWDYGVLPLQAEAVRDDLAEVGIELELDVLAEDRFVEQLNDPREHIPIAIVFPWGKDYPEGIGWFLQLFDVSGLGVGGFNTSLVGASPRQLRKWGYEVGTVPSVDDRLDACQQRRGVARTQCWAEYDQYIMNEVVPRVPYMFMEHALVVSERVDGYSFDQFQSLPALDRIALAPDPE